MLRNSIYLLVAGAALSSLACTEDDPADPVTPMPSASNTTVSPVPSSSGPGPGPAPAECGGNLLAGDLGEMGNWVGGDPASAEDNPCGIQGALYAYGDAETAQAEGLTPSCVVPDPLDCSTNGCCLSGATITDDTFSAWGCGIGLTLNDAVGDGVKVPYAAGEITGFRVTLSGTFTQEMRYGFTQLADTEGQISPFMGGMGQASTLTGLGPHDVTFEGVTCPPEAWGPCEAPSTMPFDLQIQIAGGESDAPFDFCITDITPI